MGSVSEPEPLYSPMAAEPDFCEIVDLFVQEMPGRIAQLLASVEASDRKTLLTAAHQLKGAAGGYGFWPISASAARLEDSLHQGSCEEEIRLAVDELVDLCGRARCGLPG